MTIYLLMIAFESMGYLSLFFFFIILFFGMGLLLSFFLMLFGMYFFSHALWHGFLFFLFLA
jgi:membrane-associated PAP2 superfamily phosphatase